MRNLSNRTPNSDNGHAASAGGKDESIDERIDADDRAIEAARRGAPVSLEPGWFVSLFPLIFGLVFSRAGLITATYGSYRQTDQNLFTDGPMVVTLLIMLIPLAYLVASRKTLPKHTVNVFARISIALEFASGVAIAVYKAAGADNAVLHFALAVCCSLFGSFAIFYWLRRARGTNTIVAVTYVFSAVALSEVFLYIGALVPNFIAVGGASALTLLQYPCMVWARRKTMPYEIDGPISRKDYFGFSRSALGNTRFLMASGIGVGLISIVDGFLRGYPNGQAIPFLPTTRLAYGVLTIVLCLALIALVRRTFEHVMTIGVFALLVVLASAAVIAYTVLPGRLDVGAVFTTTLNALMVGFTWYVIIAFMGNGLRDPYYYALGGWMVWLGCRSAARMSILSFEAVSANNGLLTAGIGVLTALAMLAIMGMFLWVNEKQTQAVVTQLETKVSRYEQRIDKSGKATGGALGASAARDAAVGAAIESAASLADPSASHELKQSRLAKVMGLDENASLADMREQTMRHSVEQMSRQFLLSDREAEVLALYALGYTQKRVAEELFISQATAHAHIKRIYSKTDLHSRQELIDYLQKYAD